MNKQELTNQVMEQLANDKDIMAFVAQLRTAINKTNSSSVQEGTLVYRRREDSEEFITPSSASDWQQACLDILRKTVQTTLDVVEPETTETVQREQLIAQSFNRFDEVYKALS